VHAAFLFEKARGLPPAGWPDEVVRCAAGDGEVRSLQAVVAAYVRRTGTGAWALGKCGDLAVKPVLVAALRRQLSGGGDAGELYQVMIVMEDVGEPVFGADTSRSMTDENRNRRLARHYLVVAGGATSKWEPR
jgi:hypothetical protein